MKIVARRPDVGYLDSALWVPKVAVNVEGLKRALTFEILEGKKASFLTLWKESVHHLVVPREFWDPKDFSFPVVDCRPVSYARTGVISNIHLDHRIEHGRLVPTGRSVQREAMQALLSSRGGLLQLSCGAGKTVIALDYAARLNIPTLIILDTTQLVRQWRESIEAFLHVPGGVGLIGSGSFDWNKGIVLATYHTLAAKAHELPEEVRRWFGLVVWDEAHHVSAPTFSRSADLFYGTRLGLTATPHRADGLHVVHNFHIGEVLYKNLDQELKPKIYFTWTGFALDPMSPLVQEAVRDCTGELHMNKIAGYFGTFTPRLQFIVQRVAGYANQGRKILVLSKSVDELVNLFALWNQQTGLYSDVPFPTAKDVGETIDPFPIEDKKELDKIVKAIFVTKRQIAQCGGVGLPDLRARLDALELRLAQNEVHKKCEALWNKKRAAYLKHLLSVPSTAGLMIYKVDAEQRAALLKSKQVTFAIMKYGKEGLDERSLDTVVVCEPIADRGALQQLMGRALRPKDGKKEPVIDFLEDDVGPFIGMCKKLRGFLQMWPAEEGGPYTYELIGNPETEKRAAAWKRMESLRSTTR